jgi:hypothetical protein
MSGGEGSERAHIAPNPRGRGVQRKMSMSVWSRDSRFAQRNGQFRPSVSRPGAPGVTRSGASWLHQL